MASFVSIIEDSTGGRLVLGSLLSAGHYRVQTLSFEDWQSSQRDRAPDLIVVGPNVSQPERVIEATLVQGLGPAVPVLILMREADPEKRLALISQGAREVLGYPSIDTFLLARIRTLLREAEAFKEIERRGRAMMTVGFHEAPPTFSAQKRVMVVQDSIRPPSPLLLQETSSWLSVSADVTDVLSPDEKSPHASGYLLDWRGPPRADMHSALPELRDRPHSRHAAIVVLYDDASPEEAVRALDCGASDVVPASALPDEISVRINRVLEQKLAEDTLRQTSESSLALAVTDDLTGLYNRRYADRYLQRLIAERSPDKPFALMIADIDRFKMINDGFGHQSGDVVIKEVANRLKSQVRSMDMIARYGGEEFLVVLAESDRDQARSAADRLRQSIGRTPVRMPNGTTIDVTVSIGVSFGEGRVSQTEAVKGKAGVPAQRKCTLPQLLSQADRALYRAKEQGRNQVKLAINSG